MDIEGIIEEFYATEPINTVKRFAKYLALRNNNVKNDFILAFSYTRWIDDIVDSGADPEEIEKFLVDQKRNIERLISGEITSTEGDYQGILQHLRSKYGEQFLKGYLTIMEGWELDIQILKTGDALDRGILDRRHLTQSLVGMRMLSQIVFGKNLEYSSRFEELMITWINYDNLNDMREDLQSGLLLFSSEDLDKYGIKLEKGKPIPSNFQDLIYAKKRETIKDLIRLSPAVEETNLPFIEKKALRLYFLSRALKLSLKDCKLPDNLMYGKETNQSAGYSHAIITGSVVTS